MGIRAIINWACCCKRARKGPLRAHSLTDAAACIKQHAVLAQLQHGHQLLQHLRQDDGSSNANGTTMTA